MMAANVQIEEEGGAGGGGGGGGDAPRPGSALSEESLEVALDRCLTER